MINKEEIKNITEEFFKKSHFEVSIEVEQKEELINIDIQTSDAQTLIGRQGLVLSDIQLLLRKIIKKKTNEDFYISVDIDNYKKNKENYLKDLAWNIADEVLKTGQEKEIPLVSSFDRRIVHIELQQRNDVLTESIGDGEERRIIVKPAS
ncbi:MAG: spoIIIJ-associated protein [Patescibacteria group bacterium]|nr:spoIIIJ-associated protein [Patescibacteria group bacterium]